MTPEKKAEQTRRNRQKAAANARKKRLEKYGGDENALRREQQEIMRKVGKANKGTKTGFARDPELARKANRLSHEIRRMNKKHKGK